MIPPNDKPFTLSLITENALHKNVGRFLFNLPIYEHEQMFYYKSTQIIERKLSAFC